MLKQRITDPDTPARLKRTALEILPDRERQLLAKDLEPLLSEGDTAFQEWVTHVLGTLRDNNRNPLLRKLAFDREFDSPVALATLPDGRGEQVLALQRGELCAVHLDGSGQWRPFLDFRHRLAGLILFEEGFHGLVFHPRFAENRRFYLNYSQNEPRRTVISEMRASFAGATGAGPRPRPPPRPWPPPCCPAGGACIVRAGTPTTVAAPATVPTRNSRRFIFQLLRSRKTANIIVAIGSDINPPSFERRPAYSGDTQD